MSYFTMHNHSMYSFQDGYATPKEYLDKAREIGLTGFCITEHENQASWVYFDEIKHNYPEIKMCYGVEFYEAFDVREKDPNNKYFHLIIIAKNEEGRKLINHMVTHSRDGAYYKQRVDLDMFRSYGKTENVIVSTACLAGKIAREQDYQRCVEYIKEYKAVFPHFYLEMQSHKDTDQIKHNQKVLQLAKDTNTPYIITTDSHASSQTDLKYQGKLVQIAHDSDTASEVYEGCYLQTQEEIHELMDRQIGKENVSRGLEETNKILDMIEQVDMPFQEPQLPSFPLPEGFSTDTEYLRYLVLDVGWKQRGIHKRSLEQQEIYRQRAEYELGVINQMKYDGYFLIVWDFIAFAKNNKIEVGGGRGSAGGSIVDWFLAISDLDPIKYGLIFERFLNPERISLPDIDSDFSDRSKVIEYLIERYGKENVCQIMNFSYITPVVAIKDTARILGIPYAISDKISKLFIAKTFDECMEISKEALSQYREYKELFEIASHLSGRVRQRSTHAGGVGIVNGGVDNYMGLLQGSKGEQVIQVDKKKAEKIGIVKFDLLGVGTLFILQEVKKDLNLSHEELDVNNEKFITDEKTFELLRSGRTNGVFQVESVGMKSLLIQVQPKNLLEISDVLALYRPDSMAMLQDYINRKNDNSLITYWHDDVKDILEDTYGCLVYQEQTMDIVRKLGGRSYGGADKFRKGIGSKNQELIKAESQVLYQEIKDNNYDEELAKGISGYLAEMGNYSFNKSHSCCYAILTLQTAYLKANYTPYFFKALLNLKNDDPPALNKYILDAKDFGVNIRPPHINKSSKEFSVIDGDILFGLQAIKGIGEVLVEEIIKERTQNGEFKGIEDFLSRVNISVAQFVKLVKAGALPTKNKNKTLLRYAKFIAPKGEYKPYRATKTLPSLLELQAKWDIDTTALKSKEERLEAYNTKREHLHNTTRYQEWEQSQEAKASKYIDEFKRKYMVDEHLWEFETLSMFLSNNPFESAYEEITGFHETDNEYKCVCVCVIVDIKRKKDKNGNAYAYLDLYTPDGIIEAICWSSKYSAYQELIKKGNSIAVLGKKEEDKLFVEEIKTYKEWQFDMNIWNDKLWRESL